MKMTGADCVSMIGCRNTVLNMRAPGGATQTLEPRPRPAIWVVAVAVKPGGRCLRSLGFLGEVSGYGGSRYFLNGETKALRCYMDILF